LEQNILRIVDLRSDTLTKPSPGMRQAIAEAEVGDDVFGEDPTVTKLQQIVAELLGKEAALFVASGTMGNQIAINCHTRPGDEVICEDNCHSFNYECGGAAFLSGVQLRALPGKRGVITAEQVEQAIRPPDHHFPQTRLVVLENTHNRAGGTIYPLTEIEAIAGIARSKGLKMHLDGARLWNASVASGIPLHEYARHFDSVSLCFSKGLGAPVGSILVGSKNFIDEAHRYRKIYGGGMRQAGVLAAAALYALDHNIERLADDHRRAGILAEVLNVFASVDVDLEAMQTNIVIGDFSKTGRNASAIAEELSARGLKSIPFSKTRIRFVTHLDISDDDIEFAISVLQSVLQKEL